MRFNEIDNTDKIDELLKKYFKITGEYSIVNGRVDVDGDCMLTAKCIKLPVKFNKVSGDFNCRYNELTTLEGGPTSVGGDFRCKYNQLTTLQGGPNSVGGDFYCGDNQLTTLEGGPTSVGGDFYCDGNRLTILDGGPTSVGRDFYCIRNQLTTLQGGPTSVSGDFYCDYNSSLPLLRLLFIKNLKLIIINDAPEDVVNYLNKYIGKGPGGALACAAELIKAGFRENAQR